MAKKTKKKVVWEPAPDINKRILHLTSNLDLPWVQASRVFTFRSWNTNTRAYARIWGLSKIFQLALTIEPAYVIEVISEKFDDLKEHEKDKVLIHELVHIPRTFSGSLSPHTRRRRGRPGFEDKVHTLMDQYKKIK